MIHKIKHNNLICKEVWFLKTGYDGLIGKIEGKLTRQHETIIETAK